MTTNDLKAVILAEVRPIIDKAYFERSAAVYPHVRLELKKVESREHGISPYVLYADFYGKTDEAAALEQQAERVYKALNKVIYSDADFAVISWGGEMTAVADTAADIKHITADFNLRVYTED